MKGMTQYYCKKDKKMKTAWVLEVCEMWDLWKLVCEYVYVLEAMIREKNLPPRWNRNDEDVILGFESHIRPICYDGEQLDPTEDQINKYWKAVKKVNEHLTGQLFTFQMFLNQCGLDIEYHDMSKWEVKKHMDEKRNLKKQMNLVTPSTHSLWTD